MCIRNVWQKQKTPLVTERMPPVNNPALIYVLAISQFRADIFQNALDTKLVQLDVEQIVPVILARAGAEKRLLESGRAGQVFFGLIWTFCILIDVFIRRRFSRYSNHST